MPLLSRLPDNFGILSSSSGAAVDGPPITLTIELFGQGLGNIGLNQLGITGPCGGFTFTPVPSNSGSGGYTKLSMVIPLSKTIQFQPNFYRGGNNIRNEVSNGTPTTSSAKDGGDGAAFSIDNEWMAIAGGSGVVQYTATQFQATTGGCPSGYGISILSTTITVIGSPTTNGTGGVNILNPTASPTFGGDVTTSAFSSFSGTFPNTVYNFDGTLRGAGGGGAPGGPSIASTTATAGKGNIRIYADTNGASTSGPIASVPGVNMELISSADGFWVGDSKVVVTSPVTGLSTTFLRDTTISARELKALLEPTIDLAFDVELWGEGFGNDPNLNNVTFLGPPTSDIITPVANNAGAGGYTKLRMVVPIGFNISMQPRLYSGGVSNNTVTGSSSKTGGNAAAISVNGEWMGIAGGSGNIKYNETSNYSVSPGTPPQRFGSLTISELVQPTVQGRGGINAVNPTASPQIGGSANINYNVTVTGTNISSSGSLRGGGGAGAPGGVGYVGTTPAQGGGGNIRIWAETGAVGTPKPDGDLQSVPGVYMRLADSTDGINIGPSRVVITNPINGIKITYNTDTTLTAQQLRNLLYPTLPPI